MFALISCGRAPLEIVPDMDTAPYPKMPRQDEAVAIIWHRAYLRVEPPPSIEWVQLDRLLLDGDSAANHLIDGTSYYGVYDPARDLARVRWLGRFAQTALSHEFIHAWLHRAYGDGDAAHARESYWALELTAIDALGGFDGL